MTNALDKSVTYRLISFPRVLKDVISENVRLELRYMNLESIFVDNMFDYKVDLIPRLFYNTIWSFEDRRKLVIAWEVFWNAAFDMITDK